MRSVETLPRILYTVPEVAKMTAYSASYVYESIAKGELVAVRKGRSVRVTADALEQWVKDGYGSN